MILCIDNYDSFVHNLARYCQKVVNEVQVIRHDAITLDEIEAMAPTHIILSPGPKAPNDAGICVPLIQRFHQQIPILGICLGHQAIASAFGGEIVRAQTPMHGKAALITHDGSDLLAGLPQPLHVARYHSLVAARATLPDCLMATAYDDKGDIMAMRLRGHPVFGLQFHPESILTPTGDKMIAAFLSR